MCPEPDVEVASLSSFDGAKSSQRPQKRKQEKARRFALVKMPEPDSELESLKDFQSQATGVHSQVRKRNVLAQNFEAALINAARPNFSLQENPHNFNDAAITASEIRDRHVEEDVLLYRQEIDANAARKDDRILFHIGSKPGCGTDLTVIRETRESITKDAIRSHESDCSLDDDDEDACDEGVGAADSRSLVKHRGVLQHNTGLIQSQTATDMTDVWSTNVSMSTQIHQAKQKQIKEEIKEVSKYEIPEQLNLPASEIAKLTFVEEYSDDPDEGSMTGKNTASNESAAIQQVHH